jgi:hypothetical protein
MGGLQSLGLRLRLEIRGGSGEMMGELGADFRCRLSCLRWMGLIVQILKV